MFLFNGPNIENGEKNKATFPRREFFIQRKVKMWFNVRKRFL